MFVEAVKRKCFDRK